MPSHLVSQAKLQMQIAIWMGDLQYTLLELTLETLLVKVSFGFWVAEEELSK